MKRLKAIFYFGLVVFFSREAYSSGQILLRGEVYSLARETVELKTKKHIYVLKRSALAAEDASKLEGPNRPKVIAFEVPLDSVQQVKPGPSKRDR